jgi:hypothetical protein
MFASNRRKLSQPQLYGPPGIGDGQSGMPPYVPNLGDFTPARSTQGATTGVSPGRMAFRGPLAAARQPLDLDMGGIYQAAAQEENPGVVSIGSTPLAPSSMPSIGNAVGNLSVPQKKPGFLGKGGLGWDILGTLADMAAGAGGQQGTYWATKRADKLRADELARLDAQRREDRQWQIEDRDYKANLPQYFNSGRDRVQFNPATGESEVVYDGQEDFQQYADSLGLIPGTLEYNNAQQDYVLRANGPTALQGRQTLEGIRQQNRIDLRGVPTYANLHPRPAAGGGSGGGGRGGPPRSTGQVYAPIFAKIARGERLTPGEQQIYDLYGGRGRSGKAATGAGAAPIAPTSKGGRPIAYSANGNLEWDGKAWIPVKK